MTIKKNYTLDHIDKYRVEHCETGKKTLKDEYIYYRDSIDGISYI
jgi:hypothetical protein